MITQKIGYNIIFIGNKKYFMNIDTSIKELGFFIKQYSGIMY